MKPDVMQHVNFVKALAFDIRRGLPKTIEVEDLIAYGMIGLCEAAANFDPARVGHNGRAAHFLTFAYYRVRGAIFDGLTKMARNTAQTTHIEAMRGFDVSDGRKAEAQIEDAITVRQLLKRIPPRDAAFVDGIYHADSDQCFSASLRLSKSMVSKLKRDKITKLQRAST